MGANCGCNRDVEAACELRPIQGNGENPMHLRRLQTTPEPALLRPKWREMTGVGELLPQTACGRPQFEDEDFPATNASIGGVQGDKANPNVAKYLEEMLHLVVPGWARPHEMIGKQASRLKLYGTTGEPCLFKHVSPRDIQQGYLGDCWLVSSFSALAEYPDRVRALFKQQSLSDDGRYEVRLYCPHAEEWKVVTIDDRLPFWQRPGAFGNLCFVKQSKENEFWPCLLEKAVAKLVGAYYRIDGGFTSVAMEMLTGKAAISISIGNVPSAKHQPYGILTGPDAQQAMHATVYLRKQGFDAHWGYWGQDASRFCNQKTELSDDELWYSLKEWDSEGYSIACGSRQNFQGIIAGHAYTLLRILEVQIVRQGMAQRVLMLHIRNPHMTNEWTGKWHDDDRDAWNKYPEVMKACQHKVGLKDNGVFWMEWPDFKKGFAEVAICFDTPRGSRYTDTSYPAEEGHKKVTFGQVGHQRWEGL